MKNLLSRCRGQRTQTEMAKKYGVTQQAWSKWESGENTPPPSVMLEMEKDFGVPMEDIFFTTFKQQNIVKRA